MTSSIETIYVVDEPHTDKNHPDDPRWIVRSHDHILAWCDDEQDAESIAKLVNTELKLMKEPSA
jgi:hypothetical protein